MTTDDDVIVVNWWNVWDNDDDDDDVCSYSDDRTGHCLAVDSDGYRSMLITFQLTCTYMQRDMWDF